MERREFFSLLGIGTAGIVVGNVLTSCTKDIPSTSTSADFTIDLSSASYSSLQTVGHYIYKNNIVIIHESDGSYAAISDICTHQGCTVNFTGSGFQCPCHGAQYALDGSVLRGPATRPLQKYNTSLTGNTLRIYS